MLGEALITADEKVVERFMNKITPEPNSGCWLWVGMCDHNGYGKMWLDGRVQFAHRIAYELLVAQIPDGLQIDHLCRVRCCVNPAHLEAVTQQENIRRGRASECAGWHNRVKTHCPRGHPYVGSNLYVDAQGWRVCRICKREREGRNYQRRKARLRQMA